MASREAPLTSTLHQHWVNVSRLLGISGRSRLTCRARVRTRGVSIPEQTTGRYGVCMAVVPAPPGSYNGSSTTGGVLLMSSLWNHRGAPSTKQLEDSTLGQHWMKLGPTSKTFGPSFPQCRPNFYVGGPYGPFRQWRSYFTDFQYPTNLRRSGPN